jgi:putative resolvase
MLSIACRALGFLFLTAAGVRINGYFWSDASLHRDIGTSERGRTFSGAGLSSQTGKCRTEPALDLLSESVSALKPRKVVIYARVSTRNQRTALQAQKERLTAYCRAQGWQIFRTYAEVGGALWEERPQLMEILSDRSINTIVVEHPDRLARFGLLYIECLLALDDREIIITGTGNGNKADLLEDLLRIIKSFTAKLYGRERGRRQTEQIIRLLNEHRNR